MGSLVWSDRSKADVHQIHRFIARDSPGAATRILVRIRRAAESAARMPEAGAMVPDYESPRIREVFVGNYRVIDRLCDDHILIATVHHSAQLLPTRLPER